MPDSEIKISEFEQAIAYDPNTSDWLKGQLKATKKRDVVDALSDAQALVTALKGRIASNPGGSVCGHAKPNKA